ncbi:SMP-30/gluconolactonase/LRE family protein [Geothrix fuzhouensis]|uniref:SMP-30/gluconolactonase/LRE family protein n=1 Tax=Geothrix fuzhouensis TaxID=2966451 RepID=UPI0021486CC6
MDRNGNVYTSDQVTFDVYRITPRGETSVFAHLYDMYNPDAAYAGALGMEFAQTGDLWIAMLNFMEPARHGLYTVRPDGSSELTVPMNPDEIYCPNGLAFDNRGDLFITESINGGIWKVAKGQREATLWLAHDQLVPPPNGVFGANGIAFKNGTFFVANTDKGTILKVSINPDGTPGEPSVFASGLNGPDGVALGPAGDIYVACAYGGQLIRLAEDGAIEVLIDKDLGYPTTPAIVMGRGERLTAYLANFFSSMNGVPSLVKIELCNPPRQDPNH